jgi:hypothetical protein
MLVQPKENRISSNPLLSFDPSLNTTAQVLVQGMSAPDIPHELGAVSGADSIKISNRNELNVSDYQATLPLIYISARSPVPARSSALVLSVLERARQGLVDRQKDLGVTPSRYITFQQIVGATAPNKVLKNTLLSVSLALIAGLTITVVVAFGWESYATRSQEDSHSASGDLVPTRTNLGPRIRASAAVRTPNGSVAFEREQHAALAPSVGSDTNGGVA